MSACSGHGVPVPGTSMCLCDSAWNAGSDMFDSRRLGAFPSELQADCLVPDAGVIVLWTFLLALCVVRCVEVVRVLNRRFRESNKAAWRQRPVQLLLFDIIIATPLLVVPCCLKLADRHNTVLGSDTAFTIIFLLGISLVAAEWGFFQQQQFDTLVRSQYVSATAQSTKMVRTHWRFQLGLILSYALLSVPPTLAALGLDHSISPVDNKEFVLLIIRNCGVVLWQMCALAGYAFMLAQVKAIQSSVHSSDKNASPGAPVGRSAQAVVVYLRSNVRSNVFKNSIAFVVYGISSIPPLWPFQSYTIPIIVMLLVHSMNPARVLNAANKAAGQSPRSPRSPGGGFGSGEKEKGAQSLNRFGSSNFNMQSVSEQPTTSMVVQVG